VCSLIRSVALQLSSEKYWGSVGGFRWILKHIFFLMKTVSIILIIVIKFIYFIPHFNAQLVLG